MAAKTTPPTVSPLGAIEVSTARKFLYASAVTLILIIVAASENEALYKALLPESSPYRPLTIVLLVFLLAYPVGFTINAISYFGLGPLKLLFERVFFQSDFFRLLFVAYAAKHFDFLRLKKFYKLDEYDDYIRVSRIPEDQRVLLAPLGVDRSQQNALSSFIRNVSLLLLAASAYASFGLNDWKKASVYFAGFVVMSFVTSAVDFYVRLSILRAIHDLDNILFFGDPLSRDGTQGEDLMYASISRLVKYSKEIAE